MLWCAIVAGWFELPILMLNYRHINANNRVAIGKIQITMTISLFIDKKIKMPVDYTTRPVAPFTDMD